MAEFVTGDGVRLRYVDRGSGRPFVMVPGWGASARWFEAQTEFLSNRMRVIALTPRFHGDSDRPNHGARVARVAKDIHELIESLDLNDAVLLGWSIGVTYVLSFFDLFGSERIDRFVLVCNGARLVNDESWSLGFTDLAGATAFRALAATDPATIAGSSIPAYFVTQPPRQTLTWMIADTAGLPAPAAALAFDAIVQDYSDVLPRLDRPTLAVFGAHDTVVPVGNAELFATSIPQVRYEVFEASGHCPFIDEADRFNRLLADFVKS